VGTGFRAPAAAENVHAQRYNVFVRFRHTLPVVLLAVTTFAQTSPCPADRPVDDLINEVHKTQSKKNNRNSNPFPDVTCIFGWCRAHSKTPPTVPEPAPHADTPQTDDNSPEAQSPAPEQDCNAAMEKALEAAHSVEVGDFNFADKNYRGALMRYQDAAASKANDAAIYVRLGRTYEKLKEIPEATQQYASAQKQPGPQKWLDEARSALERLQKK
jgi:hypothetical protein